MSAEMITTIVAVFSASATMIAGVWALLNRVERRMDARFVNSDARFDRVDARFDRVDARFDSNDSKYDARFDKVDARFDSLEAKYDARFDHIESEIVEVKIAVARLEGPRRTLINVGHG